MPRATRTKPAVDQEPELLPVEAELVVDQEPEPGPAALSVDTIVDAINDGDGAPELVDELNAVFYRIGAQDPSLELPRSWQRVQRRIGAEPDGYATAEQVAEFAHRAGLDVR